MNENIIDFVKARAQRLEDEKLLDELENSDMIYAYQISVDVVDDVLKILYEMGMDIEDHPKSILEIMLIEEGIRSLIFRLAGREYHFQSFVENVFKTSDESGEDINVDYNKLMEEFLKDSKRD